MKPTSPVQRKSEVSTIVDLLRAPPTGLSVCAISGPGGVGKTFLLDLALESLDLDAAGYLHLAVDGANVQARGDFFATLEALFPRSLPPPADSGKDYFPRLRALAASYRALVQEATAELQKSGAPEPVKRAAVALLKVAGIVNSLSRTPNKQLAAIDAKVEDKDLHSTLDTAWDLVRGLGSLQSSALRIGPLRDLLGITRRNRMRSDLYRLTAQELRTDLSAAIGGYEAKDVAKFVHGKIPGRRRLLLVLDDYEVLSPLLAEFLVGALVPELAAVRFDTVLVILCRDDLDTTHPGWAQHAKRYLREQIRLAPFDAAMAAEFLAAAGVPEARRQAIFDATQGYPFLLNLLVEESASGGADSALFLRKFFERTTRWMTEREQEWFLKICYLERVNEDTLALLFPADEIARIQDWFESEPSVRDPMAADFRVRPLIRDKVLRYESIRAPRRHQELRERAAGSGS